MFVFFFHVYHKNWLPWLWKRFIVTSQVVKLKSHQSSEEKNRYSIISKLEVVMKVQEESHWSNNSKFSIASRPIINNSWIKLSRKKTSFFQSKVSRILRLTETKMENLQVKSLHFLVSWTSYPWKVRMWLNIHAYLC